MTDSPRSRFRLPHYGWFLLATVALVVAGIGLSVWLSHYREQQLVRKIERWDGFCLTGTSGPKWMREFLGEDRVKTFQVFERIVGVELIGPAITDTEVAHLGGLKNLKLLSLNGTSVTDVGLAYLSGCTQLENLYLERTKVTDEGIKKLQKALPDCSINGPIRHLHDERLE